MIILYLNNESIGTKWNGNPCVCSQGTDSLSLVFFLFSHLVFYDLVFGRSYFFFLFISLCSNALRKSKAFFFLRISFFHSKSHTIFIVALSMFVCLFICLLFRVLILIVCCLSKMYWGKKRTHTHTQHSPADTKWILQNRLKMNCFSSNENRIFQFETNWKQPTTHTHNVIFWK